MVAFGDEGLLANAAADLVWFETSTNDLSEWEKVKSAAASGHTLIDAPVTGGSEGAKAGTLTMLIGGESKSIATFQSLLDSFTNKAVLMGPSGAGYITKLSQLHLNYLVAQGIGEAMMLGAKANLDLATLWSVLKKSCAQSYVVDSYIPKVLDGSYDPSFTLGLATKDMRLISKLGDFLEIELPLGHKVCQTYETATERYGESAPHLHVVQLIEDANNQLIRADCGTAET